MRSIFQEKKTEAVLVRLTPSQKKILKETPNASKKMRDAFFKQLPKNKLDKKLGKSK